jgi:hypothetical protein
VFRTAKLVTLVCALLCCATKLSAQLAGDFGRPEDSPFVDEFLPWLKDGFNSFTGQHNPASPYTDDERTLRNLAYAILQPPKPSRRLASRSAAPISSIYGITGSSGRSPSTCGAMPIS